MLLVPLSPLVKHREVVLFWDVVGDGVAGAQAVPAAGLADVQGIPHALANCLLVGAAQEIHIQPAEQGNLLSVRLLDRPYILDRVFE